MNHGRKKFIHLVINIKIQRDSIICVVEKDIFRDKFYCKILKIRSERYNSREKIDKFYHIDIMKEESFQKKG